MSDKVEVDGNQAGNVADFSLHEVNTGTVFPMAAGILLGAGLGGFFDGILLHQVLQWHHMVTNAGFSADTVSGLRYNIMLDGFFHVSTYGMVAAALVMFWKRARHQPGLWRSKMMVGSLLIGFGLFNLIEGSIDHMLLEIHHVNETVAAQYWIWWDLGFLLWGVLMLLVGMVMVKQA